MLAVGLAGCASPAARAARLARAGRFDEANALLDAEQRRRPDAPDDAVRVELLRERTLRVQQLVLRAEAARSAGRLDEARALAAAATALDPGYPRLEGLRRAIEQSAEQGVRIATAERALAAGRDAEARALVDGVLAESPGEPAASELRRRLDARAAAAAPEAPAVLGPRFREPLSLEFRDAPLRSVFESLAKASGVGFVFDREVQGDAHVTLYLRETTLDEALRIVLSTQGLERRLLNDRTMLIYPATAAKKREHEELQTQAFYLVHADVKQAQQMVRTLAKTRDIHVDERLNMMLVRDTPEVLALVRKLVGTVDLPDPEVMLDVQVLEVASDKLDTLGLQWPSSIAFGLPGGPTDGSGTIVPPPLAPLGAVDRFRGWVVNPAVVASLQGNDGSATLLANPTLRVRSHEKARILVGDRLPVFTTTATANVGVSSSVSYLDVGLKLDLEPSVLLGNEVTMKLTLEVSTVVKEIPGPDGSLAYQIGTRMASTALQLRDGQTQVLGGLINDEDRKRSVGIPGLASLPVLGALFGTQSDTRNRTEVVLLITPHVVRNLTLPERAAQRFDAGLDADPGRPPLRLSAAAQPATGIDGGGAAAATAAESAPGEAAAAPPPGGLVLAASGQARVGETVAVTLRNAASLPAEAVLTFDPALLQPAAGDAAPDGRLAVALEPQGERVFVLRVLPAAAGQVPIVGLDAVSGRKPDGTRIVLPVSGQAMIEVAPP